MSRSLESNDLEYGVRTLQEVPTPEGTTPFLPGLGKADAERMVAGFRELARKIAREEISKIGLSPSFPSGGPAPARGTSSSAPANGQASKNVSEIPMAGASSPAPSTTAPIRRFETGATRNVDENRPDYEAYLSPLVIEAYGRYMLRHQFQTDGTKREGDNWAKGIPRASYMKSLWRHVQDVWLWHRGRKTIDIEEALCAVLFNTMGYLYELKIDRSV